VSRRALPDGPGSAVVVVVVVVVAFAFVVVDDVGVRGRGAPRTLGLGAPGGALRGVGVGLR
jgi:hypothetical protein